MTAHLRGVGVSVALILGLGTLFWSLHPSRAQEPVAQTVAPAANQSTIQRSQTAFLGVPDHIRPQAYVPQHRRSIVHHYPYPYPSYYNNDETAGFRNPGGVGKYAEYYPPGNQFQVQGDPVRVAQFGVGGGYPSRAEQMQAQQIGISRYNSIQNHIDNYSRPAFGYGFGVGGFGGFW